MRKRCQGDALYVLALSLFLSAFPVAAFSPSDINFGETPVWAYRIEKQTEHDTQTFTQGLLIDGESFIESSGLYGRSFVRRYRAADNQIEAQAKLNDKFFGEGVALLDDQLYLLTWRAQQGFRLNATTLAYIDTFHYVGEGWGLTQVDGKLLMSHGTNQLSWFHPDGFRPLGSLSVTADGHPLTHLNAMTYGAGLVWANIWSLNTIVAINPENGHVVGRLDVSEIASKHRSADPDDVLNGVAWDSQRQALWVTGKRWNSRYLVSIEMEPRAQ